MKNTILWFCLLVIAAAGCQQAAASPTPLPTPLPTSTPPPQPSATPTRVAPSATSTALPLPTATPSPAPVTPIPTADFAFTELIGIWTRTDPDSGDLFLIFSEDNTYIAAHGSPNGVISTGTFTLEGRLLTFASGWNCTPLADTTPGMYLLRLAGGGNWLYLDLYADTCPERPSAFRNIRWTRYIPTPTPAP